MASDDIKRTIELVKENNQRNNAEIISLLLALQLKFETLENENKEYFEIVCKQAYLLNNKHIDKPIIENLIQEIKLLKSIIKENFAYYPDALFDKVCFKWTGPVMEDKIIEVLNNE